MSELLDKFRERAYNRQRYLLRIGWPFTPQKRLYGPIVAHLLERHSVAAFDRHCPDDILADIELEQRKRALRDLAAEIHQAERLYAESQRLTEQLRGHKLPYRDKDLIETKRRQNLVEGQAQALASHLAIEELAALEPRQLELAL